MTKNNRLQRESKLSRNRFFYDSNNAIVLFQWPNIPLSIWIICTLVTAYTSGTVQNISSLIATISLVIWTLLEITTGVNYFRRMLGLIILAYVILTRLF